MSGDWGRVRCCDCRFSQPGLCGYVKLRESGRGNTVSADCWHGCPDFSPGRPPEQNAQATGREVGEMPTLTISCYARCVLDVVRLLADLSFSSSSHVRRGRVGEFRLGGDEATLAEAAERINATSFAVCVLEEVVEE